MTFHNGPTVAYTELRDPGGRIAVPSGIPRAAGSTTLTSSSLLRQLPPGQ